VEHQLLGAKHRSHASCEAGFSKVSLNGPLEKLRLAFCNALKAGPKRFVCINDDLAPRFLAVDGAAGQFHSLVDEFLRSLVAKGLGQETPLKCRRGRFEESEVEENAGTHRVSVSLGSGIVVVAIVGLLILMGACHRCEVSQTRQRIG